MCRHGAVSNGEPRTAPVQTPEIKTDIITKVGWAFKVLMVKLGLRAE